MISSHVSRTYLLIFTCLCASWGLGGISSPMGGSSHPLFPPASSLPSARLSSTGPESAAPPPVNSTPKPVLTPTSAAPEVKAQYFFEVNYDPSSHQAQVKEHVIYPNLSGHTLDSLTLVVEPNRTPGVFFLKSISWPDGKQAASFHLDAISLTLPLPEPLAPQQKTTFDLDYDLHLPDKAATLGFTVHQANFIDWYPFLPPFQAPNGWVLNPPGHVGEHLTYDLADFQVVIHLPAKTAPQTIAAGAPEEKIGNNISRFKLENARNFAWSISPVYQLVTAQTRDVNVSGYVFPEHVASGQSASEYTADALTLYSGLFSPYQHKTFSFVEVDFADGMESDGIFFLNKNYFAYTNGPTSGLCALSAHETAHQWWFGQVGNNQALYPWLDESLATYSELLYYQKLHPDLVNWWWQYRVNAFKPAGNVSGSIYDFQSYRPYVNAVYLNGVMFLDAVHQKMGDAAFLAFLRQYDQAYAGKQASPNEFLSLLSQTSPVDLQPILSQYFPAK